MYIILQLTIVCLSRYNLIKTKHHGLRPELLVFGAHQTPCRTQAFLQTLCERDTNLQPSIPQVFDVGLLFHVGTDLVNVHLHQYLI